MISKDERQAECVSKWRNAKGRGTLNLTFRFGKTRVADIILTNYINKMVIIKFCFQYLMI